MKLLETGNGLRRFINYICITPAYQESIIKTHIIEHKKEIKKMDHYGKIIIIIKSLKHISSKAKLDSFITHAHIIKVSLYSAKSSILLSEGKYTFRGKVNKDNFTRDNYFMNQLL